MKICLEGGIWTEQPARLRSLLTAVMRAR